VGNIATFDLARIIGTCGIKHFVETGTGRGAGVEHAARFGFESIHSCEIERALAEEVSDVFAGDHRISIECRASADFLLAKCHALPEDEPILFFLDAHFPGADFGLRAFDDEPDDEVRLPLAEELRIIAENRPARRDVIIADDLRIYLDDEWEHGNIQGPLRTLIPAKRTIDFVTDAVGETHQVQKVLQHEGYLVLMPKGTKPAPKPIRPVIYDPDKPWALVCRFGGVGDNCVVASALPLLAEEYNVEVIAAAPHHVVFENNPSIAKLSIIQHPIPGDLAEWWRVRRHGYAHTVHLSHSMEAFQAFQPHQTYFELPDEARRWICRYSYLEVAHAFTCVRPEFGHSLFFPTEAERDDAQAMRQKFGRGKKIIGWHVSGTRVDKVYPHSGLLISRLIRELDATVFLMGGPTDRELAQAIADHVKRQNGDIDGVQIAIPGKHDLIMQQDGRLIEPKINPKFEWGIRRQCTMAQSVDLLIAPDSGLAWAASMEPVPKILLHSHASPTNITKYWRNTVSMIPPDQDKVPCWPCHKLLPSINECSTPVDGTYAGCISSIPVESIVDEARRALAL
jgi:ADP-heptose:LPS heptosyltransferase